MESTTDGLRERTDWIGGFLFVGNHLALDFLNTKLVVEGETVDKLPDREALDRWSAAAGIGARADSSAKPLPVEDLTGEDSIEGVRAFRERLREAVLSLEAGRLQAPRFVEEVNQLLAGYPAVTVLSPGKHRLIKQSIFAAAQDGAFWGAIAASAAELLTELDPGRIRKCENCILHFYDTSKKGARRWCSMNLCGNRLKVAAYQKRQRSRRSSDGIA